MPHALIVTHGQPSDPEIGETEVQAFARKVDALWSDGQVRGVSLAAEGRIEAEVAAHPDALIYPMFMTDGWFTRVQIPRRVGDAPVRRLAPFGTDPALAKATARALQQVARQAGRDLSDVPLAILAHGSGRSPMAALDTVIFADRLRRHVAPKALRLGFVEQAPSLEDALTALPDHALALPFFATRRGHVLEDLPQAATNAQFKGQILDPLGLFDMVPEIIARRLAEAAGSQAGAVSPDVPTPRPR